jgi:hypothetical protein
MAEKPGGKSFQNFLIAWAAVASIAAVIFGGVAGLLYLRLQRDATPGSITAKGKDGAGARLSPGSVPKPSSSPSYASDAEKPKTAFNALPRGTQVFDGITFQIRGPVNLIGARAAKAGGREFARISNQPVAGRGKYIHVLHTGDHGTSPDGTFVWRLVLHYADGQSKRFDFAYGVHIRNYWWRRNQGDDDLTDPDSSIAWIGTSLESDRKGAELRISRTTLLNPRPEIDVTSVDYVSLLGPSSAYVFAVTLADDERAVANNTPAHGARIESPAAPNVVLLPFLLQNGDGTSTSTAAVDCVFEGPGFAVRFLEAPADAGGRVIVDVPTEIVSRIRYTVRNPAGVSVSGTLEVSTLAEQTIRLLAQ